MKPGDWTWLELTKVLLGVLTPLTVFYLSFVVDSAIQDREFSSLQAEAIREYTQDIYSRRVRAELLAAGLRRHAEEPTDQSLSEVIERKARYDEAYSEWNKKSQANLLVIRKLLESDTYTELEDIVEQGLVLEGFKRLDNCLTNAYHEAIRGRDPVSLMNDCDTAYLLDFVLRCGSNISDGLYGLSRSGGGDKLSAIKIDKSIKIACGYPV
ncbi:hypothetical protein [Salipiger sp. CCB-MM3]|uniref:hypothetical protein n=1 Tax=Salipiger sp. CCB-MM3 TaxID=1792508 RepID=UPI0012FA5920|nr:hypothetical protein [Salipiger sp. CCB-MM3]